MALLLNELARFAINLWGVALDTAPWLALGLLCAAALKVWLPANRLTPLLGGKGLRPILWAALVGTPLPLCSCGVLPAALGLRRGGASRGATVSFLIATPENGVDSLAVSYAMLGPFLTVVRPVAAIVSACLAGLLAELAPDPTQRPTLPLTPASAAGIAGEARCCDSGDCHAGVAGPPSPVPRPSWWPQLWAGLTEMIDDLAPWLAVGLVVAAALNTFVPAETLTRWGSGLAAMMDAGCTCCIMMNQMPVCCGC